MENEENKASLEINTNDEGKKLIEDTYNLYTNQKVEIGEVKRPVKKGTSPLVTRGTGELMLPKPEYKQIESINSLNNNLQQRIKNSMNGENKAKIQAVMKEMELQQDSFFMEDGNVFTDLKKSEKSSVEKKIVEMQVPKEITEINVSAIISCIGNIKTKKNK